MDLNERFRQPDRSGALNELFSTEYAFEPIRPVQKAPIQQGTFDWSNNVRNLVGEKVRDNLWEWAGRKIQPDTVVRDGKIQSTENKTFNNLSTDELNARLTELTASSPEEADGVLYKLRNPRTNEVKYGRAGDDVWKRYAKDITFQENWEVEYQRPMKDTKLAERLIHGNKKALTQQSYSYGNADLAPLQSGGTEIYKADPLSREAMSKVKELLSPEQQSYAEKVWDGLKIKTGFGDITEKGESLKNLTPRQRASEVLRQLGNTGKDFSLGASIGIYKAFGGLSDLVGDEKAKKFWQDRARQNQSSMYNKDSISGTFGEIAPEIALPAVGNISKGASLGKRILQGVGSGALITGGYEKLKEQSGIKEGLDSNVALATGLGGVIGGMVGAVTKNPVLGKEIGSAFENGDDQMREAILTEYPEARGALEAYVKERQASKKKDRDQKTDATNPITGEVETVSKREPLTPKPERKIVKPERQKLRTKSGALIDSQDVKTGKETIEDIEYNVVEPKAEIGKHLENQMYVPEVNNPKKFKYGYDSRGRIYTEESTLMSPQGGSTQKASLEQRTKPEIGNAKEEVNRRLEFYENDSVLRERYGQTQASYKTSGEISKSQELANRMAFEKDQYKAIIKDKELDETIRQQAREELSRLNKQSIADYETTATQLSKAERKFEEQFKVADSKNDAREKEISTEYSLYKEAESKGNKEGFVKTKTKSESEIKRQIVQNATEMLTTAKKAISELTKKEKLEGKTFDVSNITKEQRQKYRDEIASIEDVQNARSDLRAFKEGRIGLDELQYREKRRIDDQIDRTSKAYKTLEDAEKAKDELYKKYESIGIEVKKSETKLDKTISRSDKKEKPEKKAEREAKELRDAETKHGELIQALREYKHTKKVPRYKRGDRAGQKILSDSQMRDIDEGILSLKEIADKKSPVAKKEDLADIRVKAKEHAIKKVTEHKQKSLGIVWQTSQKDIKFKDTIQDASNSVAQITAVLLGSKNLARLAKTAGDETIGDIREIIGNEMQKLLPKDFPITASKETVKPIFMTENYGQGQRGLVRDIMKNNGVSKEQAQQFLNAYNKSFDRLAPELKQLREKIMEVFKSGNGEIKYTMPDGFQVEFKLKKTLDGKYTIKGKNVKVKVTTDDVDDMSAAILPNIIHSVDAYVARQMMKNGISTVHDAFYTPKGKTDEFVRETYGDVMSKLNDSNLLEHIAKSIGDTGAIKKIGDLESEAIKKSAKEGQSIKPEHSANEVDKAKERQVDLSKDKTDIDIMKEFMAKDNVREENFNQLVKSMTNEAGYRTMSVARDSDDVFERQVALAHQSEKYNPKMAIKAPDGVNVKVWDKAQREIFEEARAKLEFNPLLNNVIKGERKYFTETGKVIGQETKTIQELLVEEKRIGRKLIKSLRREELKAVRQIAQNYDKLQMVVKNWAPAKQLNNAEAIAKSVVEEARTPKFERSAFKKNVDKLKAYFKDQVSTDKISTDFQKLLSFRTFNEQEAALKAENLKKSLDKKIPKSEREMWTESILRTDYNAIQDLKSEDEAEAFMREHNNLYKIVKDYVDQGAKAIGESSEQVGFFRNNARAIQEELGLPIDTTPIIDRMISIKAMTPKAWSDLEKIRDTDAFKFVMEIISNNKKRSAELFKNNPHQQVKGYVQEVYKDAKEIVGDKIKYSAGRKQEAGAIPSTLERKKVGSWQEEFHSGNYKNMKEKSEFARENRLKITEEGAFRRVADAKLKDEAGRSRDFNEILSATFHSIEAKEVQQKIAKNIIDEIVKGNEMFSQTPKEGYREIKEIETQTMPKVVADSLAGRYIREDYDKRLLGRLEETFYRGESHVGQIADRLLRDATMNMKQNVVLKNPKSYANTVAYNQLLAASAGIRPDKLVKYQAEAMSEIAKTDKLRERIALLEASGKDASRLKKELVKSLLYKMEEAGLAVNKLEVSGNDKTLIGTMLSDLLMKGKFLNRAGNEVYLTQDSVIGKEAFKLFGRIDAIGRYTVAKGFMDKGETLENAVKKANGLYADMGQMAPAFIELMDKYPLIPFLKWATLMTPSLMKLVKDNPVKSLGLAFVFYGLQAENDVSFESASPVEGTVNFWDGASQLEFIEEAQKDGLDNATWRKIQTYSTPKVYSEISEELKDSDHNFIIKKRMREPRGAQRDLRPLSQRAIGD